MMSAPAQSRVQAADNRSQAVKDVAARLEFLCLNEEPVDYRSMLAVAGYVIQVPEIRQEAIEAVRRARGAGVHLGPEFQGRYKAVLFREWTRLVNSPGSDVPILALYAHFHPNSSSVSYLELNPYVIFERSTIPGSSMATSGPKFSGKSDWMSHHFEVLDGLKDDHVRNGDGSMLAIMQRARSVRRKAAAAGKKEPTDAQLMDEASIGTKNLSEDAYARWSKRLGLREAKDVRWVTNIAIRPTSPRMSKIQWSDNLRDTELALLDNSLNDLYSLHTFDEAATSDDSQRSMTWGSFVTRSFINQSGKLNCTESLGTQSQKKFREQVLDEADIVMVKEPPPKPGSPPTVGWLTIRGRFDKQRLTEIPGTSILFETKENAQFAPNLDILAMWNKVAALRRDAINREEAWSHAETVRASKEWIYTHAFTQKELASDANPFLRQQIRDIIEATITREDMGRYEPRELARRIMARHKTLRAMMSEDSEGKENPQLRADAETKVAEEIDGWYRRFLAEAHDQVINGIEPNHLSDPDDPVHTDPQGSG